MTLEVCKRPEELSFVEMRAHFSRHEPRVGPHFRKVHNVMHFHNVHSWGKRAYHSFRVLPKQDKL
jgi:hypothetical protein